LLCRRELHPLKDRLLASLELRLNSDRSKAMGLGDSGEWCPTSSTAFDPRTYRGQPAGIARRTAIVRELTRTSC
jgi:hypothetical protein